MPSQISIHALLAESDVEEVSGDTWARDFYPRSPCGERRVHYDNYNLHCVISIHALLAESDIISIVLLLPQIRFLSTLSLRRATPVRDIIQWEGIFLSTLSLRRATHLFASSGVDFAISIHALLAESDLVLVSMICLPRDFYPRSPCGERLKHS